MQSNGTRTVRALTGVVLLVVHVLSCTELVALILAMAAGAAGDHRVLISHSRDSLQVRLAHSNCPKGSPSGHCHCLLSRMVVALADQPLSSSEDHVLTLQNSGSNSSVQEPFEFSADPCSLEVPAPIRHAQFLDLQIPIHWQPQSIDDCGPKIPCCGVEVLQTTVMLI
jgi:hypothetical protein